MRNKQLNIEGITSISKGGVLYRSGEVANLTKEQIAQAKLVSKLPSDFPLANWESMSTKQQLHAMKFSGLNEKDQWDLLNSKVPLIVLDQHNQLQNRIESASLAARAKAAPGKSTISTSLQNDTSSRKLGELQAATRNAIRNGASSRDLMQQKKDELWNRIDVNPVKQNVPQATPPPTKTPPSNTPQGTLKPTGIFLLDLFNLAKFIFSDKSSADESPKDKPKQTPKPDEFWFSTVPPSPTPVITPTPSPKPSPTPTPKPTANLDMISDFVDEQRNSENDFFLFYSQNKKDRSDCSTQAYDFYEIKGDKNPLRGAEHETCKSYYEKFTSPPDSFIEDGGIVQSSVPSDIRHGIPAIPDNWQATTEVGDLVIWKVKPEYDKNGYLIKEVGADWHIGICIGDQQMVDRGIWEENNPNGKEYGIFARGLDTVKSSYNIIMIIKPGDNARLTRDDIYHYLLNHQK